MTKLSSEYQEGRLVKIQMCTQEHETCDARGTHTLTMDMKMEQGVIYSNPRCPGV